MAEENRIISGEHVGAPVSFGWVIMATDSVNEDRYANQGALTHGDGWLSFLHPPGGGKKKVPEGQTEPRQPHTAK